MSFDEAPERCGYRRDHSDRPAVGYAPTRFGSMPICDECFDDIERNGNGRIRPVRYTPRTSR